MGKSRSRSSYEDDAWEEKEEKFISRRERRSIRDVNTAINEMIKEENINGKS